MVPFLLLKIMRKPCQFGSRTRNVAVWKYPRALPQYNLGHGHIVEAIRDAERASPGLFFAGNSL